MSDQYWRINPRYNQMARNKLKAMGKYPYDPSKTYSARELELVADLMLMEERNAKGRHESKNEDSPWLSDSQIWHRRRHEIITEPGIPDPAFTVNSKGQPGMYWRREPQGGREQGQERSQSAYNKKRSLNGKGTFTRWYS